MANFDIKNDVLPVNANKLPSLPTISALRTALTAYNSTSYSSTRLDSMTENDMIYACRVHSLSVAGL